MLIDAVCFKKMEKLILQSEICCVEQICKLLYAYGLHVYPWNWNGGACENEKLGL